MRRAGVLMPIFSLPSPWGIGTMGAAAKEFVDFLASAMQSCWQVLPMGPTSYGDSPYQSYSSFAGNPYFIDLDLLAEEGLLKKEEISALEWGDPENGVDYNLQSRQRFQMLRLACGRLEGDALKAMREFREAERDWIEDYALFMALKDQNGGKAWTQWPEAIRLREEEALKTAREELEDEVAFWCGVQYLFFRQWDALKAYANGKGIKIIGDLPIYVSPDSADVWANPECFQLDSHGRPTEVAGCPPDAFSEDGQLWGNPLFDWDYMAKDDYAWWGRRMGFQFRLYDTLRIDHFRGFEAYYAIPAGEKTARNGRWRPGPGWDFFRAMKKQLGERDIIAENLGFLTDGVQELLEKTKYPGMKVLEFGFGADLSDSEYLPHNIPANSVVYAGTHDNDTILGWYQGLNRKEKAFAREYMHLTRSEGYHWGVIRTVWASAGELAVVQMQDLLGLGHEARMNTPSTLGDNWKWRMAPGADSPELARKMARAMQIYQRAPKTEAPKAHKRK